MTNNALPLYGLFMQKVYKDKGIGISTAPFPKPAAPLSIELDCSKYYGGQRDTIPADQKLDRPDPADLDDKDI